MSGEQSQDHSVHDSEPVGPGAGSAPTPAGPRVRHRMEGPRNHYITFMISILLTMLAFGAVLYGKMTTAFLLPFLVILALVQVLFQLSYWMHMKDRGHTFPIIGISFGAIVALTAVTAGVYWIWW